MFAEVLFVMERKSVQFVAFRDCYWALKLLLPIEHRRVGLV